MTTTSPPRTRVEWFGSLQVHQPIKQPPAKSANDSGGCERWETTNTQTIAPPPAKTRTTQ